MKNSCNTFFFYGIVIAFVIALIIISGTASAQPEIPEGIEVFHVEDRTCIRDVELGKLICWCTYSCEGCEEPVAKSTPRSTSVPTDVPTSVPTDVPPTLVPPTPKPKCNRGLGNLSEGCDPGQSGGKPGSAGEDNE